MRSGDKTRDKHKDYKNGNYRGMQASLQLIDWADSAAGYPGVFAFS